MLNNEQFAWLFYRDEPIDPDEIADEQLKDMYLTYIAHELDTYFAGTEIEAYIERTTGKRRSVLSEGDEDPSEQSDKLRVRLSH